ncbi:Dabb family protein [Planctomicrobium sp. SH664]|uniref:Dabb family protein n=1 Tax=Planctomicrobium sp. SH664 TaxID=3448125 RepID=UPI003F5C592A
MLVHNVFFTLHEDTDVAIENLIGECQKYLDKHDGVTFFAAGPLVKDLTRPVNDLNFHVALTVVFKDKAAHDVYQTAPRHLEFIERNKPTWKQVRVFDSYSN